MLAWLLIGVLSLAAYMTLALLDRPIWDCLPFLALIMVAIVACGTAGTR